MPEFAIPIAANLDLHEDLTARKLTFKMVQKY